MKRRAFLATAAVLTTTGCLGRTDSVSDSDDTDDCPTMHSDNDAVDTVVCAGASDGHPITFTQDQTTVSRGGVVPVTLGNDDADEIGLNPHDWTVYRETDSGWKTVREDPVIQPWTTLSAGDRIHWRVGVGDADPDTSDDTVYGDVLDLASGSRYAFSTIVDVDDEQTALVAPFTVE
ncbi:MULTISPECIES: hypothetical protein [Halobacterium]|uniref:Uncharacterized protein n=3 Tax=Halobacterium salinarum TaxID=2242 RepID=Q9HS51_HALSA|nr:MULTISPECIES: hypothetical protein [Halobacterium]AAG18957.1 hypothetical protein VNG_0404H [Halobacterium salinarum NRC-1]TYO76719.1 hypothetical protein APQ99_01360 [Halobacterium salinarum DSM 3754]CAP13218.1 uncharacterized protein OE_1597F [Halobacterium salinarum R1]MDL0123244.1 hypothetical protein [Halobacterium salinarum]MDL0124059.1 hypothetical protein [Halobacterium salinarum]